MKGMTLFMDFKKGRCIPETCINIKKKQAWDRMNPYACFII